MGKHIALMFDKGSGPQWEAGRYGAVLNIFRYVGAVDAPLAAFTPRSLEEHEHDTLQVSVLLRDTSADVGWHTASGDRRHRRLTGGQAYIVPPGQPHDFRLHRPDGMVNFHIDGDAFTELSGQSLTRGAGVLSELTTVDDPLIQSLAAAIHAVAIVPDEFTRCYIDSAWTMLAVHLARLERRETLATGHDRHALQRVLAYIDAFFATGEIRVADLAAVAGLSPMHFTRVFTREVGVSPMQYVIGRRLDRSRERLARERTSIGTIAHEAGFGTHARFSEAFRRRFGVTPSAFRIASQEARLSVLSCP